MSVVGPQFDRLPAGFQPTTLIIPLTAAADGYGYAHGNSSQRLAYFGDEAILRTRHHFEVLDGRTPRQEVASYPSLKDPLPAGTALRDICRQYPNHVSGRMLLVFDSAGWTTRKIWAALPVAFKLADPLIRGKGKGKGGPNKKADKFPFRYLYNMMKAQKMAALMAAGAAEDQLSLLGSAGASGDGANEGLSEESMTLC